MMPLLYGAVFCLGAIIGSFLNVLGLRLLREESLMPRSYCYQCQTPVRPYDNIPILSWFILRGRCRACKARISWQYPAIEFITACLFVLTFHHYGVSLATFLLWILIANFMVVLITDFREHAIYDINSIGLIPFGLLYSGLNLGHIPGAFTVPFLPSTFIIPFSIASSLAAIVLIWILFKVLNLISLVILGKEGFGDGDTRLLMGMGAYFGLLNLALILLLSFVIQTAVGIPMVLRQWIRQRAYKTVALLGASILLVLIPYVLRLWVNNIDFLLITTIVFGVIAMICALLGLRSAKNLESGLTYLPFGPAIVLACLLLIFAKSILVQGLWQLYVHASS